MSTLLTIGAMAYSNPVMGVGSLAPILYDNFGTTELLAGHVADPLPLYAPPSWSNVGVNVLTINSSGEVVHSSGASYAGYVIDASAPIRKIEFSSICGVGGDTGFILRMDAAGSDGVYVIISNDLVLNKISVRPYLWSLGTPLQAAQEFTAQQITTYRKITVTDDGTDIVVSLDDNAATALTFSSITNLNTQQFGGIYSESSTDAKWKDFKMWIDEPSALTAANYPSFVNIFPVTPSYVTTVSSVPAPVDVIHGLTLGGIGATPDADIGAYDAATGTMYSGSDPLVNDFHISPISSETRATIKAYLDGPSNTAPIALIFSGFWNGGNEEYARSAGYGNWAPGTEDYLAIQAPAGISSAALVAEYYNDATTLTSPDHVAITPTNPATNTDYYSHLVIVDPTVSRITSYVYSDYTGAYDSKTATVAAATTGFEFSTTSSQVTFHQCSMGFMALAYPNAVPTAEEAKGIVLYHYRKHKAKQKVLHPWFDGRAKAT